MTAIAWRAVLCGVNSRFSQTNPAIRSLAAYAAAQLPQCTLEAPASPPGGAVPPAAVANVSAAWPSDSRGAESAAPGNGKAPALVLLVREHQTGQPVDAVARDLLDCAADLYAFSCYIWNRRAVFDIIASLRRMQPQALIAVGGPEVSFSGAAILKDMPDIDFVISGEGEAAFAQLLAALRPNGPAENHGRALDAIAGLAWRDGSAIRQQAPSDRPLDMAALPFPYESDLPALADRLLYYESSRGCPFRCSYCLSSIERQLRFRPLEQTLEQLDRFIAADVRIVKFVDRTFNCNPQRARAIWFHLIQRSLERQLRTCFHFELAGDLLEAADLALLATAPAGLFQFEIGVQSIHPATLARIHRVCNLSRLFANVQALRASGRQHLHLDLIAGLPGESLADVIASFNALYRLEPDQLQLGFLKLLPGTPILAAVDTYGYKAQPFPPYEVLASQTLNAKALSRLHDVEAVLEQFANGGHFRQTLAWLVPRFADPYEFFEKLAEWIARNGLKQQSLSIEQRAVILSQVTGAHLSPGDWELARGLLRFDHYGNGRKDVPDHLGALEATATPQQKAAIAALRRRGQPGCRIRVESYPFSVSRLLETGQIGGDPEWAIYDLTGLAPVLSESLPPVVAG